MSRLPPAALILMFPLLVSAFTAAIGGPDLDVTTRIFSHSEFAFDRPNLN